MARMSVAEAKKRFLELVRRAEVGEATVIEKRGTPAAVVIPHGEYVLLSRVRSYMAMRELARALRGCGVTAQGIARDSRAQLEGES
jgi:prevent-host-death family protein